MACQSGFVKTGHHLLFASVLIVCLCRFWNFHHNRLRWPNSRDARWTLHIRSLGLERYRNHVNTTFWYDFLFPPHICYQHPSNQLSSGQRSLKFELWGNIGAEGQRTNQSKTSCQNRLRRKYSFSSKEGPNNARRLALRPSRGIAEGQTLGFFSKLDVSWWWPVWNIVGRGRWRHWSKHLYQ